MCIIACRVTIYSHDGPSYVMAYHGFGMGELQDIWRKKLDPLGGEFASGTTYHVAQVT